MRGLLRDDATEAAAPQRVGRVGGQLNRCRRRVWVSSPRIQTLLIPRDSIREADKPSWWSQGLADVCAAAAVVVLLRGPGQWQPSWAPRCWLG